MAYFWCGVTVIASTTKASPFRAEGIPYVLSYMADCLEKRRKRAFFFFFNSLMHISLYRPPFIFFIF